MSIATNVSSVSYTGNGVTTYFPFTGKFLSNSDLRVSVTTAGVEVVKTINAHYTVSGAGDDAGGNVTFLTAPAVDTTVTIQRNTAYTQPSNLVNNGVFDAEVIEDALDRVTLLAQQVKEQADRAVRMPVNEASFTSELPSAADRAGTLQGFDTSGNPAFYEVNIEDLELVAPDSVTTSTIEDGAVTAAKLATTLDLSAKSLTLPNESVLVDNLENNLDFTYKTVSFADEQLQGRDIGFQTIGFDRLAPSVRARKLAVGFVAPSPDLIMSGAGLSALNGTWVYGDLWNARPRYFFPSVASYTHYLQWDAGDECWCIVQSAGSVLLYSSTQDTVYPDAVTDWDVEAGGTAPAPGPLSLDTEALEVNGTVVATAFRGDVSQCTGKQDSETTFGEFPAHTSQTGCYCSPFTAFINADGYVVIVGGPTSIFQPSGIVVTPRLAVFKQSASNPVTGVTDNLNGFTDTVVKLVQSGANLLALTEAGFVYAMGLNQGWQLGQGGSGTTSSPYFVAVKIGSSLTCTDIWGCVCVEDASDTGTSASAPSFFAKTTAGVLYAWGRNHRGQLGMGDTTNRSTPSIPTATWGAKTVSKVVGTNSNSYVLTSDGYCYATGYDTEGQCGTAGAATDVTSFVLMDGTGSSIVATDIFCAGRLTRAVWVTVASGTVYACGYNGLYGLGLGNTSATVVLTANASPVQVTKLFPMGVDRTYCLAVKTNNTLVAWGANPKGQSGTNTAAGTDVQNPTAVSGITLSSSITVTDIVSVGGSLSDGTTLVLMSDGKVYSAGYASKGTLGNGTSTDTIVFARVPIDATITAIHAVGYGDLGTFLMADDLGRVWAFGGGTSYQLGNGQNVDAYVPILLS